MLDLPADAASLTESKKRPREENCGDKAGNTDDDVVAVDEKENNNKKIKTHIVPNTVEKNKPLSSQFPKNVSLAALDGHEDTIHVVKLLSLRGNYWKTMGHSGIGGVNLLHLEEALYLMEKRQLLIQHNPTARLGTSPEHSDTNEDAVFVTPRQFYELVVKCISLECYLTYVKLKVQHCELPLQYCNVVIS